MFNLIVTGNLKSEHNGLILASRVFSYTEDEIIARFMPNGKIDIPALMALPTVFMNEGTSDEVAGIGWLYKVKLSGRYYEFQYALDPNFPRMSNAVLYALAAQLEIEEWEFSTNHWAIKDVDLFQVLYQHKTPQRLTPSVFELSNKPVNSKLISMMMPFSESFDLAHQTVKSALEADGYECRRADDFWLHTHIIQDIIELICTSRVVICDLSDKNPNVFYEAGIAHTLGKEVILITRSKNDVPFDLRSLRYITYLNNQEGCDKLARDVMGRLHTIT